MSTEILRVLSDLLSEKGKEQSAVGQQSTETTARLIAFAKAGAYHDAALMVLKASR